MTPPPLDDGDDDDPRLYTISHVQDGQSTESDHLGATYLKSLQVLVQVARMHVEFPTERRRAGGVILG